MESLGKNRLIHRKITSITLALLLGAGGIAALPPDRVGRRPVERNRVLDAFVPEAIRGTRRPLPRVCEHRRAVRRGLGWHRNRCKLVCPSLQDGPAAVRSKSCAVFAAAWFALRRGPPAILTGGGAYCSVSPSIAQCPEFQRFPAIRARMRHGRGRIHGLGTQARASCAGRKGTNP